jgi:aspartyl protease family protein
MAEKLGLRRGPAQQYNTANGVITGYLTRLNSVRLGDIELHDIRASINPRDQGDELLLGMSFLRELEFTQRGDTLTIRQY